MRYFTPDGIDGRQFGAARFGTSVERRKVILIPYFDRR
jgi:hypothetical protein